ANPKKQKSFSHLLETCPTHFKDATENPAPLRKAPSEGVTISPLNCSVSPSMLSASKLKQAE
ncbi:MAG: hypothetical protein ACYSOX_07330, partial [Planctomycetota bacterium]